MHRSIKKTVLPARWWYYIVAPSLFIVFITTIYPHVPDSRIKWYLIQHFSLAGEMNVAVWWSGVLLVTLSLLTYELFFVKKDKRVSWLILSIIFLGLSLDEIGSIHERVGGWSVVVPVILLGAVPFLYAVLTLLIETTTRKSAILILAGFGLFGSVAVQEYIEHIIIWQSWMVGLRVGIEEGTELLGMFFCFVAVVSQSLHKTNDIRRLLPVPSQLKYLATILLLGLLLHVGLTIFASNFSDFERRGNPGVWYPLVVLFIIAVTYLWELTMRGRDEFWLLVVFLLISSIGTLYFSRLVISDDVWSFGIMVLAIITIPILRFTMPLSHKPKAIKILASFLGLYMLGVLLAFRVRSQELSLVEFLPSLYLLHQLIMITLFCFKMEADLQNRKVMILLLMAALVPVTLVAGQATIQVIVFGGFVFFTSQILMPHLNQLSNYVQEASDPVFV